MFSSNTVYKETDMNEIWQLFEFPEYKPTDIRSHRRGYSGQRSRDFLRRAKTYEKFKNIDKFSKRFLVSSPVYMEFLKATATFPARPGACLLTT